MPTAVPNGYTLSPDLKTLKSLWPYIWPKSLPLIRGRVLIACICLVVSKLANIAVPLLFKDTINDLISPQQSLVVIPVALIFAYGLARLMTAVFSELRDGFFAHVTQRAVREVALNVFQHLHNLGLRFHLERETGGVSRAIERGIKGIETLLQFMSFNIIPTIVEIIMVSGLLWWLYGALFSIITMITMISYVGFTLVITEWRIGFVRTMNTTDSEANTKAIDSLLNFETVKYFGNEDHEASRFDNALQQYETAAVKSKLSLSLLNIGQMTIASIGLVLVMLLAAYQITAGILTVGDYVAVNTYLIQLYVPLFLLGFSYREVKLSLANMESMFKLLYVPQEIRDQPSAPDLVLRQGEVSFENVSFYYTPDRPILKDISFQVPPGQTVAIVGSSGAGKSTIARLLFRFYDVTQGSIKIDGQDIKNVTQQSLRRTIGVVPQDTVLFNDTIGYNIAYGRPTATEAEIVAAAKGAHIHDFISKLPAKYNTRVGERGLKLSGGEKQRVAIARTLLKGPKIFLFDEATSALDTKTEKQIQQNLEELAAHHTTVIIAHRLSTVIDAHEILVLDQGEIVERGTHKQLLQKKGLYAAMWQRQQEQFSREDSSH